MIYSLFGVNKTITMENNTENLDFLTQLNNMKYLQTHYAKFLSKNECNHCVAIDLQEFKKINDLFGHKIGDVCLKCFADGMKDSFPDDSILIRRSGDEFVIVSHFTSQEVKKHLSDIAKYIELQHNNGSIPLIFAFNCGLVNCESTLDETLLKADITMYDAKSRGDLVATYTKEVIQQFNERNDFINKIDDVYKHSKVHFAYQEIWNVKEHKSEIFEMYARNDAHVRLFNNKNVNILENNFRAHEIDMIDIASWFINYADFINSRKVLISIQSQTLLYDQNFATWFDNMVTENHIKKTNIILSVNIADTHKNYAKLYAIVNELASLGYKMCVYKTHNVTSFLDLDMLLKNKWSYLKVSHEWIEEMQNNPFLTIMLKAILDVMKARKIKPIFTNIETPIDEKMMFKLCKKPLAKGYLYSKEISVK